MAQYCFWFQLFFFFLEPLTRKSYWLCLHCCLSRVCYSQPALILQATDILSPQKSKNLEPDLSNLQEAVRTPGPIELHFRVGTMPFLGHVKLQGTKPTSTLALPPLAAAATSSTSAIWRAAVTLALRFCSLPEASTPRNSSLLRKIQRAIGQPMAVSTAALPHIPSAEKCFLVPITSSTSYSLVSEARASSRSPSPPLSPRIPPLNPKFRPPVSRGPRLCLHGPLPPRIISQLQLFCPPKVSHLFGNLENFARVGMCTVG